MGGTGTARRRLALALLLLLSAAAGAPETTAEGPLKLGVVSFSNPRLMFEKYQPLVEYLTSHDGRPWSLDVSSSYEEAVEDLCAGRVTLAHLGPLTYARAHARCGADSLVRLESEGGAAFSSDVLVRTDSPFERLEDLAGHRVGFGDPLSTSGHLVPRAMLLDAGLEPGPDVECLYFGQHERAARAVLIGEVEACGVRDVVGDVFLRRGLRRLARSAPVPNYPLVVTPGSPASLREELTAALVGFPGVARARRREERRDLELAGSFKITVDTDYDPVRRLAERVFGPGYLTRPEEAMRCP